MPEVENEIKRRRISDDVAYLLPMAAFLILTLVGTTWPSLFPISYVIKTAAAAILLIVLWKHYTKITWNFWWLGIIVGIIGLFQWVGMELLLLKIWPNYPRLSHEVYDPTKEIVSTHWRWSFIAIRWAGATLLVPFMEELFWRDFLWRTFYFPNDFKLAPVGIWDKQSFWIVALAFSSVHIEWMTAIVWALLIGFLLVRTKSLGACIIAHATTNFLLGAYVLITHDWRFW